MEISSIRTDDNHMGSSESQPTPKADKGMQDEPKQECWGKRDDRQYGNEVSGLVD